MVWGSREEALIGDSHLSEALLLRSRQIMDLTGKLAELDRNKGALLFLDEIEALAVSRDGEIHEASRRMLSVLLRTYLCLFIENVVTCLSSAGSMAFRPRTA